MRTWDDIRSARWNTIWQQVSFNIASGDFIGLSTKVPVRYQGFRLVVTQLPISTYNTLLQSVILLHIRASHYIIRTMSQWKNICWLFLKNRIQMIINNTTNYLWRVCIPTQIIRTCPEKFALSGYELKCLDFSRAQVPTCMSNFLTHMCNVWWDIAIGLYHVC